MDQVLVDISMSPGTAKYAILAEELSLLFTEFKDSELKNRANNSDSISLA